MIISKLLHRFVIAALILCALPVWAGTPRILLVGDSWAWFLWLNRSFQQALNELGLDEYEERGLYTTVPGSKVDQWTDDEWLDNVRRELEENPTIDIVHLSLGGNDFLRGWKIDMPLDERDRLFQSVVDNEERVAKYILSIRPNIRVAICNYDYINKSKGKASLQQLNQAGMILGRMKKEMAQRHERIEFIQNYGVMQHYFGVDGIEPGVLPLPGQAPHFEPFPGGDPERGNPEVCMFDDIHLNQEGYKVLAKHCVEVLYRNWLLNPLPLDAPAQTLAQAGAPQEDASTN